MVGLLMLVNLLLGPHLLPAAPVPVRFVEGVTHGFLLLRTVAGALIASGDLLQVGRGGSVESRMVFHFKDGSLFDETVVFTQQHVFTVVKNLPKGSGETVHLVAFTPAPRIIQLELAPKGEHKMMVGEQAKTAIHAN